MPGKTVGLYRVEDGTLIQLASIRTNDNGRTDSPILPKENFQTDCYALVFLAGACFGGCDDPGFWKIPLSGSASMTRSAISISLF
ncbi:hypothetical protein V8J85_08030 [Yoonia sp. 2307UL14-13]|uniref:hypothetical protein n=1 Tax=Yoonia sp. 2307UL14-13 TaxID=3126506 RepID=UPI0030A26A5A